MMMTMNQQASRSFHLNIWSNNVGIDNNDGDGDDEKLDDDDKGDHDDDDDWRMKC